MPPKFEYSNEATQAPENALLVLIDAVKRHVIGISSHALTTTGHRFEPFQGVHV